MEQKLATVAIPALRICGAAVEFPVPGGRIRAVDDVDLEVQPGEAMAVVGESGCGKTTLARAVLGLQPLADGEIQVAGQTVQGNLAGQAKRIGMVWQDPFASIEPKWTVRKILEEPVRLAGQQADIAKMMEQVGLAPALAERYPHELSGGQRQRAAIARAIALRPPLVICDEPTAALDLSIQAQILNLLKDLKAETGCAFLYITHDLQTVRYLADRVAVMYMGQIVEIGPTEAVFTHPKHPYTQALLASSPSLEKLGHIPDAPLGEIPEPTAQIAGCRFASRCPFAQDDCQQPLPGYDLPDGHRALCIHPR
ncbi:MAG: ABC transporter ATP-binding protein [Armatimonadetes bacterium]|nr:ABC transporter ATP-binding protein [Armatimonadota bacterium]